MIRIEFLDCVVNSNVCVLTDNLCEYGGIYYSFFTRMDFGKYVDDIQPARGELIGLASIINKMKLENIVVAPALEESPDRVLEIWRSQYKNLSHAPQSNFYNGLLQSEAGVLEGTVIHRIMVKNLPAVFYKQEDKAASIILAAEEDDLPIDKVVLALVAPSDDSKFSVVGFRKAVSKQHLNEIIKQSNDHNLLVYYCPFVMKGKEMHTDGVWMLLPSSLRSFNPNVIDRSITENVTKKSEEQKVTMTADVLDEPETEKQELTSNLDGFVCPYCQAAGKTRTFGKKFGLSNHINNAHPDKKEDYAAAYKD